VSTGLVRLIAVFKLAKGVLLLVAALGTLEVMNKDVTEVLGTWASRVHLDPDGRVTRAVLRHAADLHPRRLVAISAGMFFYAALLLTEGIGLMLDKRWAEYFTVIVTASFVPLEIYEIGRRTTAPRIALLVVNLAIIWYLIARLRR
jgi:uncharacterized membrane protein (DUF2068 family)